MPTIGSTSLAWSSFHLATGIAYTHLNAGGSPNSDESAQIFAFLQSPHQQKPFRILNVIVTGEGAATLRSVVETEACILILERNGQEFYRTLLHRSHDLFLGPVLAAITGVGWIMDNPIPVPLLHNDTLTIMAPLFDTNATPTGDWQLRIMAQLLDGEPQL